jgi:hypothetical protein
MVMKPWLLVVVGLACVSGAAQAQGDAAAPDDGRQAAFGALKYRTLVAEAAIDAVLHPPGSAPDGDPRIYFGTAAALELKHVRVTIDGGAPVEQDLSPAEARTVAGTGDLFWLEAASLPDGAHQVHVAVLANDATKPDAGVQSYEADAQVDFEQDGAALELNLAGSSLLAPARLEVREHRAKAEPRGWLQRALSKVGGLAQPDGSFVTGSSDDPRLRYAAYLSRLGRDDAAAVELLAVSQEAPADALPDAFWLTLAAALRQAHLPDQAATICDQLDARGAEREAVGVERLRLGLMQHRFGNAAEAEKQLLSARNRLPADRVQDWQVAYSQLQFDRQQFAEALRTLRDGNAERIDAYRYMDQSVEAVRTAAFRRFNLAVAMVHEGDEARGLSLLDLVGRLKSGDSELLALRDKANLTLGWHFLRDKQGATAMGILGRVRSEGRFSGRALLGMGWAELEPGGKRFERVRIDNDADDPLNPLPAPVRNSLIQLGVFEPEMRGEVGPKNFSRERPAATREEGLRRALSYWNYLAERDPREPAVLESLLASGYAYDTLGDTSRARAAYDRAIATLEARRQALAEHAAAIRGGALSGGIDGLNDDGGLAPVMDRLDLPPEDSAAALYASVDRYLNLARLKHGLAELRSALAGRTGASADSSDLLTQLASAQLTEARTLNALAQQQLDLQKDGIDGYLKVAYFAAARASDNNLDHGN